MSKINHRNSHKSMSKPYTKNEKSVRSLKLNLWKHFHDDFFPVELPPRFMTLALKLMQELTVDRQPRMKLEGNRRWMVEYFKGDQD